MVTIRRAYDAFRTFQTSDSKPLILFSAPAVEIEKWSGVPERRRLAGEETAGFQREQDPARVRELAKFFKDDRNVAQNPLLGALQDATKVHFKEKTPGSPFGRLEIEYEDYSKVPLRDLLQRLTERLEERVGALNDSIVDERKVALLLERESERAEPSGLAEDEQIEEVSNDDRDEVIADNEGGDVNTALLAEETHLVDFYVELKARMRVLQHLGVDDADEIQGFTKAALLGYLKPVVLVDGQHRLRGAVLSAEQLADTPAAEEAVMESVQAGLDPGEAEKQVLLKKSRHLPVSLLMDSSPSEHVFQFVIVNQKAVLMGSALLGTIISTSLGREELQSVRERLKGAGIQLEDSQAIAYLTRAEDSPFRGLVQTGVDGDRPDLLKWSVLQSLVTIFRKLQGGRPYHERTDYARAWRLEYFPNCGLASGDTLDEKLADWSRPDGPWREIFVRFYVHVRDYFGDTQDLDTYNAWGSTGNSNLFNKISLTILACDYFDFIYTQGEALETTDDFDRTLQRWLKDGRVSPSYFNRDWRLEKTKKDQLIVKRLWSQNWHEYRKVPANGLPRKFKP
ncbi:MULTISPECIES: ParB N-terminal domain-containing protein [Streptomyces]|uniref:DGQHR domain-containing protein n=1 Tax=Streptomyces avermitilis TaxID=33903 RepID=A0A4D4LQK8_STRAX|nr:MULTISPECIES: hypothetical protein [Streptomyces]MYS98522.1 hypothetical protein [Streptomyces sp. SID5469]BBJ50762.1 hypothetical protein SAVMC3_33910 [Streptomyces avermitilis]GDY62784.1 hypothetical protein SAV14893_021770 [Streptomyces avermitilis]GDY77089.1 hypothetical protein SAV31267_065740 [Streptomyces avermitilis]GDY86003.1 hypothetical protein SAVCW2_52020 [Streptomyces avermitilis]